MENFNWKTWKRAFASKGNDLRKHMQQGLVFGVMQYREHGNSNYLYQCVKMGDTAGYRGVQLIAFVLNYCPSLEWTGGKFLKSEGTDHTTSEIPTVKWWTFKKAPLPQEMNPREAVLKLIKRIDGAAEKGTLVKGEGDDALITGLKALVAKAA